MPGKFVEQTEIFKEFLAIFSDLKSLIFIDRRSAIILYRVLAILYRLAYKLHWLIDKLKNFFHKIFSFLYSYKPKLRSLSLNH